MSYLEPPPMPAPVVVVKDVGGVVKDYQNQTEIYRATDREVRLHECRSACTMALSLPNVCVYPDSILKFHQAYNLRNRQTDAGVSEQLFESYPTPIRTRLGNLTRQYRVLRGRELIDLGVRNCNEPRREPQILVASVKPRAVPASTPTQDFSLTGLVHGVMTAFGTAPAHQDASVAPKPRELAPGKPATSELVFANFPLPPPRPTELAAAETESTPDAPSPVPQTGAEVPLPPRRPMSVAYNYVRPLPVVALPRIITGAQLILPIGFTAYAEIQRRHKL